MDPVSPGLRPRSPLSPLSPVSLTSPSSFHAKSLPAFEEDEAAMEQYRGFIQRAVFDVAPPPGKTSSRPNTPGVANPLRVGGPAASISRYIVAHNAEVLSGERLDTLLAECSESLSRIGASSKLPEVGHDFPSFVEYVRVLPEIAQQLTVEQLAQQDSRVHAAMDYIVDSNSMLWIVKDNLETLIAQEAAGQQREDFLVKAVDLVGSVHQVLRDAVYVDTYFQTHSLFVSHLAQAQCQLTSLLNTCQEAAISSLPRLLFRNNSVHSEVSHIIELCAQMTQTVLDLRAAVPPLKPCTKVCTSFEDTVAAGVQEVDTAVKVLGNKFAARMGEGLAGWVRELRVDERRSYSEVATCCADAPRGLEGIESGSSATGTALCIAARLRLSEFSPKLHGIWRSGRQTGRIVDTAMEVIMARERASASAGNP